MKKQLLILACTALALPAMAQIPDGSTAADFTFTDISGGVHHLYDDLNAGKTVVIDVSATWCGPCWQFHSWGRLDSLYKHHDVHGDNTMRVLFMEGDPGTGMADLQGTAGGSQGDWITGADYPIINDNGAAWSQFDAAYQVPWYPSFYVICPNKKVWTDTLNNYQHYPWPPTEQTFEWLHTNKCAAAAGLDDLNDALPLTIAPNPAKGRAVLYFRLNAATTVSAQIMNSIGQVAQSQSFGQLSAGDQQLSLDLSDLPTGIYTVQVAIAGRSVTKRLVVR